MNTTVAHTTATRLDVRLGIGDKHCISRAAVLRGMPVSVFVREAVLREADSVIAAAATPDMRAQLLQMGAQPVGSSAQQMAQQIQREVQQFGALARRINLNLD